MQGLMMDRPLTITEIMRFAERNYGFTEVVSITADLGRHRCTYAEVFGRARQLASRLAGLGLERGARVATLAWNDFRHLELYYGVSCAGFVLHTINPRLFAEQIRFIIEDAQDSVLFVDPLFVPLIEQLWSELSIHPQVVVLTSPDRMPESSLELSNYEDFLAAGESSYQWPLLDERDASVLCYTSGTTGNPKGVLFDHRSTVLHAYAACLPNVMAIGHRETLLPVVPMFHVNAWGTPYAAPLAGAKLVFPGPKMADGETLHSLIDEESVTLALGVPTVWLALLDYLKKSGKRTDGLNRIVVGGSACPASVFDAFEQDYGVTVHHAWGMTEMSPLGTFNSLLPDDDKAPQEDRKHAALAQGRAVFGVEMKIVDDANEELPWDGVAFGALKVRGNWVCSSYFGQTTSESHDADGWFSTGDVATIDAKGYMRITDRTKDVIKSGGEWISSIELENVAVGHPGVAEAAVIGVHHQKWAERPLLVVVPSSTPPAESELLDWFKGKVAKWWVPDAVEFVEQIPHTATGKINKATLREQFGDYRFPD